MNREYRNYRLFSVDFPLMNRGQIDQNQRLASQAIQIIKKSLDKGEKKCLKAIHRAKQNEEKFKQVENELQKFNKRQLYVGSLAINLASRADSPNNNRITSEQCKNKSKSSYLTTYESYNKKLQLCQKYQPINRQQNTENLRKNTTVHRIIAPMLPKRQNLRLKLDNRIS